MKISDVSACSDSFSANKEVGGAFLSVELQVVNFLPPMFSTTKLELVMPVMAMASSEGTPD